VIRRVTTTDLPDALRSPPGEPVVWAVADSDPLPAWATADVLTASELERVARTTHPRARVQFVRGRTVLRAALGLLLDLPPHRVPLVLTADGKPVLDPATGFDLHFNVSHTDGVAMFAVSPVPVGVDVETHRDGRDLFGLVDRFFAPEEREQFRALPTELQAVAFLRGWTGKEAILKGVGCGVRELANCAVDLDPRRPPAVRRAPDGADWKLTGWAEAEVAFAVAVSG
jgi:4'-phosphopantetheinyl transferase